MGCLVALDCSSQLPEATHCHPAPLQHQSLPLAQLLAGPTAALPPAVGVNGLLDCQGTPEEAAAEAAALLQQQPYAALKIKVGRRVDPLADAAAVLAIRQAVGPEVVLRADANRRWTLEQAVQVGAWTVWESLPAALAGLQKRSHCISYSHCVFTMSCGSDQLLTEPAPPLPPPQFGKAAAAAQLQYIEEPVASPSDLPEFHRRTGMAVALDESVDAGERW